MRQSRGLFHGILSSGINFAASNDALSVTPTLFGRPAVRTAFKYMAASAT